MLLIPSVPVPLREGHISRGLLLRRAGRHSPPANVVQETVGIGLPLLLSGGQEALGLLLLLGGARRPLLQVLLAQAGQASQGWGKTGLPTGALLPLSQPFSHRELAFAGTFKNLYLLVV